MGNMEMMFGFLKNLKVAFGLGTVAALIAFQPANAGPSLPSDTIHAGILRTAPPFAFVQDNNYKGMTYDILQAIAKKEGFKVDLRPMGFDAMIPAMQAEQIDVAVAGFFVTEQRKKIIDFSTPFFKEGSVLAVPIDSPIKSYEDLKGKTIVSQQGSAALALLNKIAPKYDVQVGILADSANMLLATQTGNADGIFFDSAVVAYQIAVEKDHPTLRLVGDIQSPSDIAFALPKGSPWKEVLDEGLDKLRNSGELEKIVDTYVAK
ncbi:transporter substrate-binding domain-containing protein [Mesorhizobium sp. A623]